MWWHKWSRWVLGTKRLTLEVGAWHAGGVVKGAMLPPPLSPSIFNGNHAGIGLKRGGGSISPLTTPPPCHAPTSKDNFLVPFIHLLYLCHHILPLVNKLLWNLHWKMSVNVKSLERNLIGIPISEWINALFIIVSHLSWHCQPKCGFRTPKYLPGCLKYCCMHICMYIFDPVCIFMISGKCM